MLLHKFGQLTVTEHEYLPMLYAIIWDDVENSLALRKSARAAHLARVHELVATGRLVVGGPFPAIDSSEPAAAGFAGGLIVAEFQSREEAEHWINEDPYTKEGVIGSLNVKPFIQVVP
tara:strand:- start:358 stop:711 length:354 start_codon:yes stop_codon:yes gene_type:complete